MKAKWLLPLLAIVFIASTLMAGTTGLTQEQKMEIEQKLSEGVELSPNISSVPVASNKDTWDILYYFNAQAGGQPGIETNGEHIFTSDWRAGQITFYKYEMDGTFVESFDIAGVSQIRDMAYDGTYFYGSSASMTINIMDLENQALIGTIPVSCAGVTGVRHIAYDPELDGGNGGFWIGNWDELGAIDMNGNQIYSNIGPAVQSLYGSAYDPWTDGGPYLWLFSQDGGSVLHQFDIATQTFTGVTHNAADIPGFDDGIAGGAATYTNPDGNFVLLVNVQQTPNLIAGYELAVTANLNAPGAPTNFVITPGAVGALEATLDWVNPAIQVNGDPLTELTSVEVYRNDVLVHTVTDPVIGEPETWTDTTVPEPEIYTYKLIPINSYGNGLPVSDQAWIGEDVPAGVTDLVLTDVSTDDLVAQLTWVNPTEGLHGGYFPGITGYHIVRSDGAEFDIPGPVTEWIDDTITDPGIYWYEVTPFNDAGYGPATTSNSCGIGITVVEIGNAEVADYQIPMNIWYQNSITECVYDKEWIGTDMIINTVAYHANIASGDINPFNLEIWIGEIDVDDLTAGWIDGSQLTMVYDGTVDVPAGDYWCEIPLDTPFEYQYLHNLVVMIIKDDDEYYSTSDTWWTTESGTNCRTLHEYSDYDEFSAMNPPPNPNSKTTYPDVQFYYSPPLHGNVAGTVTDNNTGNPIEGANVWIGNYTPVTTGPDGTYLLEDILVGMQDIYCTADGYYDFEGEVEVIADTTVTYDIGMEPEVYGNLEGTVTDTAGNPIEDAEIYAVSAEYEYTAYTDDQGYYLIEDMVAGTYDVTCSKSGFSSQTVEDVEILVGQTTSLDFVLEALIGKIIVCDLDPTPMGQQLVTAIEGFNLGVEVIYETSLSANPLNEEITDLFILLGIYNNNYQLTEAEAGIVTQWIDTYDNRCLYMEGGDTWYYDPQTSLHPYFNINGIADGSGDLSTIDGIDSFWDGKTWSYVGENNWIDHLSAIPPAIEVLQNPTVDYTCGVAYDAGTYKTVGASFEITGMTEPVNKESFEIGVACVLAWFGYPVFTYGNLEGYVTELSTGNPIEDAEVTIGSWTGLSGSDGHYIIEDVMTGTYPVTCEKEGYNIATVDDVEILEDQTTYLDFALTAPTLEVSPDSIYVTLPLGGTTTEYALVENNGDGELYWHASIVEQDVTPIELPTTPIKITPCEPVNSKKEFASFSDMVASVGFSPPNQRAFGDIIDQWSAPNGAPMGIDWDPDENIIWYASENAPSDCLYKIDIETHSVIASYPTPNPFGQASPQLNGICVVGDYLFLTDYNGDLTVVDDFIMQVDKNDFTVIDTWEVDPTIDQVLGISYRDPYFYIVCNSAPSIYEVDLQPGGTFEVISTIPSPAGAALSGIHYLPYTNPATFWMTSLSAGTITETDGDFNVINSAGGPPGENLFGITWPGEGPNFWLDGFGNDMMYIVDGEIEASVTNWVIIDPNSGTLSPGTSQEPAVIFDATDLIPGTVHNAQIVFTSVPNVGTDVINVQLTVEGGAWGSLDGTVTDANNGEPIENALITATSESDVEYTAYTNDQGYYIIDSLLASIIVGNYTVTCDAGVPYTIGEVTDVEIIMNETTTVDFALESPLLEVSPLSFSFSATPGDTLYDILNLNNPGTAPVDFDIDIGYITKKIKIRNRETILCVDRDGSATGSYTDDWPYFQAALDSCGYAYDYYEVEDLNNDGPDLATMQQYDIIIWFSGEAWGYYGHDCMTDNDEANLGTYLDEGGTLFLSAHDYLYASYPNAGTFSPGQFPYDYLGMRNVSQDTWSIQSPATANIEGVAGSLAEGFNFDVQDIYTTNREGLYIDLFVDHVGIDLFNVVSPAPPGICANQYDSGTFKTIFTTASFAAITDPAIQADLMEAIINYLSGGAPPLWWLEIVPDAGTVPAAASEDLDVIVTAPDSAGTYYADIVVYTEPDIGTFNIPVQLEVQELVYGYLDGTVTLEGGSGNVEDVVITANGYTTNPDSTGYYWMEVLPGTYDVTAHLDGYFDSTAVGVVVEPEQTTTVDFYLEISNKPNWVPITGTQYNMVVMATITLFEEPFIGVGDNMAGAFGPNHSPTNNDCRSVGSWQAAAGVWYFTIVGNEPADSIDISFKIYDEATNAIYDCNETVPFADNTTWGTPMDPFLLTAPISGGEQEIALIENWNWISTYIHPDDPSIEAVFGTLGDAVYQVKSQTQSAIYENGVWIGDLTEIVDGEAYVVKMNEPAVLTIEGDVIPYDTPIGLTEQWNWIAYLPEIPLNFQTALAGILDNAEQIKNQTQSAFKWNNNWYGNLTVMEPGIGYKVNMTVADELVYQLGKIARADLASDNVMDWKPMAGTQYNMVVIADVKLDGKVFDNSDYNIVSAFDKHGKCRSVGKYENDFWYFTVVGNVDGDDISFRLYDGKSVYESAETITFTNDNVVGTPDNPITISMSTDKVPDVFKLTQNYPNPFNPDTKIAYQLPVASNVEISIYNIKGERVRTLVSGKKEAGYHSVIWNGKDNNNRTVSSGIYFYRINTDRFSDTKKMLLMK